MMFREVHRAAVKNKFYALPPANSPEEETPPPTIALPNNLFVEQHVKPLFRANGSRVVTSSTCTLRRALVSNRPRSDQDVGGAVYSIPCCDCDRKYFGQTGRNFGVRLNEHKAAVRLKHINNACAKHVSECRHSIDWPNAKPVYRSNRLTNRLVVESTLIKSYENFNNCQSSLTIENLAAQTILKANPSLIPPD